MGIGDSKCQKELKLEKKALEASQNALEEYKKELDRSEKVRNLEAKAIDAFLKSNEDVDGQILYNAYLKSRQKYFGEHAKTLGGTRRRTRRNRFIQR